MDELRNESQEGKSLSLLEFLLYRVKDQVAVREFCIPGSWTSHTGPVVCTVLAAEEMGTGEVWHTTS